MKNYLQYTQLASLNSHIPSCWCIFTILGHRETVYTNSALFTITNSDSLICFLCLSHYHSFTFLLPGTMTCPGGLSEAKEQVLLPSLVTTASLATLQVWWTSLESNLPITQQFSKQSYWVSRPQMIQINALSFQF